MRLAQWIVALAAFVTTAYFIQSSLPVQSAAASFDVMETTIEDVHKAYSSGQLSARQLTQMYLDRIEAYDKDGPKINCVITVNPKALEEADALDAAFKKSGFVGPLHGIPVVFKDQMDVAGIRTTLGSVVFENYVPTQDSFVVDKLRKAGAIVLAKVTLGELGGGDTFGSLFGETHNPYDLERTAGGSSGGTGAAVAANFATVGIGQEGFASIRRPSTWNSIVGMRPTAGLVSRTGVYAGWPSTNGSLGPMTRQRLRTRVRGLQEGHRPLRQGDRRSEGRRGGSRRPDRDSQTQRTACQESVEHGRWRSEHRKLFEPQSQLTLQDRGRHS
jgi:Asp-tRNA(Asn)/Glu-tRNA(Gln) amidotransferase A subunit family amidase